LLVPEVRSEDQASPLPRRLATCSGRIGFTRLGRRVWDGRFASGCSPPRLAATQWPSATRRHVSVVLDLSSVSLISITHARGSAVPALCKAPRPATRKPIPRPFRLGHPVRSLRRVVRPFWRFVHPLRAFIPSLQRFVRWPERFVRSLERLHTLSPACRFVPDPSSSPAQGLDPSASAPWRLRVNSPPLSS